MHNTIDEFLSLIYLFLTEIVHHLVIYYYFFFSEKFELKSYNTLTSENFGHFYFVAKLSLNIQLSEGFRSKL